jgi:two-component system, NtrC family, sensor kinase
MRRGAKPAKAKGESKRPVARKSGKGEGSRVGDLEKRLAEALKREAQALEQQTATSEILRVISSSPTDVQPVFNTVVQSGLRLLGGYSATMMLLRDDDRLDLVAYTSTSADADASLVHAFPMPLRRLPTGERAVHERRAHAVEDIESAPDATDVMRETGRARGWRSNLFVPMIREDVAVGLISLTRREPGPFAADQIALLEIFAAQAVIAIENVRLFNETKEALEQQTATSEILRVISSSPGDIQPVFDAIAANAARLCDAVNGLVIRFDGQLLHLAAHHNVDPERLASVRQAYPRPPSRGALSGRAILTRAVVHVPDVSKDPEYTLPAATTIGYRSVLAVPMMHEGVARGTILVARDVVAPFSDAHIALIQTFADQAVIATENVRLFKELEARTHDLTRSVDELRALGEVGQAINSTLDLQAVLSTIVARATQLSGTDAGVIYEYDAPRKVFLPRATEHLEAEIVETMLATPVRKGEGATGRLAEVQEPVQVPDILTAPAESRVRDALVRAGYRALLAVPLVREEHLLGGLTVIRKTTGAFAPEVIELLRTFATQSALAIQNARLFLEIEEKSRELEAASHHKSEFLANMSHELRTPLNAVIGFSEVLRDRMFGDVNEKQEEYLNDINASGQHLLSLINDILDLSKIEAGRMELELTDFHVPAALDNALTLVRERAGRRGITVQAAIEGRIEYLRADERKIKQVLLNLLSNAIKFTPEGGRIDVRAAVGDGMVEVSVIDTGVGIAPEDQEAIFEEFRQVGTADKKIEGTGLGLALSRKFVELHGGRIWVESQVGVGSTFTFTIPIRTSA